MTGPPPCPGPVEQGEEVPDAPAAAALLRRAAHHLERLRAAVPDGRWSARGLLATRPEIVAEDPAGNTEHVAEARSRTARWILTMSPDLAAPLVDWLRVTAAELDQHGSVSTPSTSAAVVLAEVVLERVTPARDPSV